MSTGRGSPSPSVTSDSCSASAAAAVSSPRSSALIPKTSSSSDLSNTITATTTTATTTLRSTDSCSSPSTMTTLLLDSLEQFGEDAKDHVGDDDTADEDDDDDEYVDAEEGLLVVNNENSNNPTIAAGPLVDPATFLLEAVFRQILLLNRQSLTFLMGLRAVSRTWATLVFAALNSQLNLTLFAPGGSDSLKSYVRSLVAVNLLGDPFYRVRAAVFPNRTLCLLNNLLLLPFLIPSSLRLNVKSCWVVGRQSTGRALTMSFAAGDTEASAAEVPLSMAVDHPSSTTSSIQDPRRPPPLPAQLQHPLPFLQLPRPPPTHSSPPFPLLTCPPCSATCRS